MMCEFKIRQLAEEFGVHRNTIRNWIKTGTLPAKEGPGRKYLVKAQDYQKVCRKFGLEPNVRPLNQLSQSKPSIVEETDFDPMSIDGNRSDLLLDSSWAEACLTCGTCASACPISGVDGLDPRKIVRMAVLGMDQELIDSSWPWKCTMTARCE